jgi:hypothetical protein
MAAAPSSAPMRPDLPASTAPAAGAELIDRINTGLATLAARKPDRVEALLVGVLTPVTLGVVAALRAGWKKFQQKGESNRRLLQSLDESLREARTAYRHDVDIMAHVQRAEAEIVAFRQATARYWRVFTRAVIGGVAVALALMAFGVWAVNRTFDARVRLVQAVAQQVQSGELAAAIEQIAGLSEAERQVAQRDPAAEISLLLLNGREQQALERVDVISDPQARAKALNYIAVRLIDSALRAAEYHLALAAAEKIASPALRQQKEDEIRADQARRYIANNKFAEAKSTIGEVKDATLRSALSNQIEAKQPPTGLGGF